MTFSITNPYSTSIAHTVSIPASSAHEQEAKPEEMSIYDSSTTLERKQQLEIQSKFVEHEVDASLWNKLHSSTREIHREAMQVEFLKNLIAGNMSCSKAYVVYLCNLFWLHQELEAAQAKIVEKYGEGVFIFPVLYRSQRLLEDIKLWSFPNPTAPFFADMDVNSERFLERVKRFVEPCVLEFVRKLEASTEEDPIWAIGAMYALYGTILSGGQLVKIGVKQSFLNRIDEHLEEDLTLDDENTMLKTEIIQAVKTNPAAKEAYAEKSVSFFCFDPPDFQVNVFKRTWHAALNLVPEQVELNEEDKKIFIARQIQECQAAIRVVLDSIVSLHQRLSSGQI